MTQATKTTTTEKYTAEQTAQLLTIWAAFCDAFPNWATVDRDKADQKIEELATQFQKKTRSIIAKLTRHEKYIAKTHSKNSGTDGTKTKQELSEIIGKVLGLSQPETESLNTTGKQALTKIMLALAGSVPVEVLTPSEQIEKSGLVTDICDKLSIEPDTLRDLSSLKLNSLRDLVESIYTQHN